MKEKGTSHYREHIWVPRGQNPKRKPQKGKFDSGSPAITPQSLWVSRRLQVGNRKSLRRLVETGWVCLWAVNSNLEGWPCSKANLKPLLPCLWCKAPEKRKKRDPHEFSATIFLPGFIQTVGENSPHVTAIWLSTLTAKARGKRQQYDPAIPHLRTTQWVSLPSPSAHGERGCLAFRTRDDVPFSLPF